MAETVTIAVGDGTTVQAEIVGEVPFQHPGETGEGYGDVGIRSRAASVGSAVTLTLDGVRDTVRSVGRWAAQTVTEGGAAGSPDSFEVEFGIKLAVKSGQLLGVIAEAGTEASLTVRLSWDLASRRAATASGGSPGSSAAAGGPGAGTDPASAAAGGAPGSSGAAGAPSGGAPAGAVPTP